MTDDITARARAALEGVTPGPWEHRTGPDDETPTEYFAGTLRGNNGPIHVLIAYSTESRYAYVVPAITGDGPASAKNARFIAAARTLVPELLGEVVDLQGRVAFLDHEFEAERDRANEHFNARQTSEAEVRRLRVALNRMAQRLKAELPLDHEPFSALKRSNVIAEVETVLWGDQ